MDPEVPASGEDFWLRAESGGVWEAEESGFFSFSSFFCAPDEPSWEEEEGEEDWPWLEAAEPASGEAAGCEASGEAAGESAFCCGSGEAGAESELAAWPWGDAEVWEEEPSAGASCKEPSFLPEICPASFSVSLFMDFDLLTASRQKTSVPFPSVTKSITAHTTISVAKEEATATARTFFLGFCLSFLKVLTGSDRLGTTAEEPDTVLRALGREEDAEE